MTTQRLILLVGALVIGALALLVPHRNAAQPDAPDRAPVLEAGLAIPDGILRETVQRAREAAVPREPGHTLLLVVSAADCLSCANFGFELRVLRHRVPELTFAIIGVGRDGRIIQDYFRANGMQSRLSLDYARESLLPLGVDRTPVVVIVDSANVVRFIDTRRIEDYGESPLSEVVMSWFSRWHAGAVVVSE